MMFLSFAQNFVQFLKLAENELIIPWNTKTPGTTKEIVFQLFGDESLAQELETLHQKLEDWGEVSLQALNYQPQKINLKQLAPDNDLASVIKEFLQKNISIFKTKENLKTICPHLFHLLQIFIHYLKINQKWKVDDLISCSEYSVFYMQFGRSVKNLLEEKISHHRQNLIVYSYLSMLEKTTFQDVKKLSTEYKQFFNVKKHLQERNERQNEMEKIREEFLLFLESKKYPKNPYIDYVFRYESYAYEDDFPHPTIRDRDNLIQEALANINSYYERLFSSHLGWRLHNISDAEFAEFKKKIRGFVTRFVITKNDKFQAEKNYEFSKNMTDENFNNLINNFIEKLKFSENSSTFKANFIIFDYDFKLLPMHLRALYDNLMNKVQTYIRLHNTVKRNSIILNDLQMIREELSKNPEMENDYQDQNDKLFSLKKMLDLRSQFRPSYLEVISV